MKSVSITHFDIGLMREIIMSGQRFKFIKLTKNSFIFGLYKLKLIYIIF